MGFTPAGELGYEKGWSLNYTGNIWSKNKPVYALSSLGLQKSFSIGEKFEGDVAYNRWFLNDAVRKERKQFTQNVEWDASYEPGNFSAGFYSMFLWGKSFSSFYSPSFAYEKSWWLGKGNNLRYSITAATLADFGNYNASAVPFSSVPRGYLKKKKNNPSLQPSTVDGFGFLKL
ncbi:MAG: hypothetical protein K2X48_13500 [Chitinophagaceae bacterium]|nr:hypothetical protein [Chitinophagaceae bacterium]